MEYKRIELDEAYMQMAEVWAKRSYATRLQVGAIVVKDKRIISDGYNGMPSGFPHEELELDDGAGGLKTNPIGLHAESNALMKLACGSGNSDGATMYVTDSPCEQCAKLIIQAKIVRVVYRRQYRDTTGVELLVRAGIIVDHLKGE
jgi:dCMP deaminase